eukprot:5239832-Pyramimonas_sp.AAC.1
MNLVDSSCREIRYTESEDIRTDEGKHQALTDFRDFKGERILLWGSIPCAGGSPWQSVDEAHYF